MRLVAVLLALVLGFGSVAAHAQVPISTLPAASTPLAGTEIVPIVQGGVTKRATVSQFTSGLSFGTAATQNIGTSGANVPLLNGANTWSAAQTFASGLSGALTGNASTSTKWAAPITLTLTGSVSGAGSIDGSGNVSIATSGGGGGGGRVLLTASRTYYVATTGSDGNDCLSAGTPCLTVQHAIDLAYALDFNGQTVTIQVADGTYAGSAQFNGPAVGQKTPSQFVLQGNVTTPANVVFSFNTSGQVTVIVTNNAMVTVQGVKFTGASALHVSSQTGSSVFLGLDEFGAANIQIYAVAGGYINITGNLTFSGSALMGLRAQQRGMINMVGRSNTMTGSPAYSIAFAYSDGCSDIESTTSTFTGTTTGTRYTAAVNGVINTQGGGASYFPGNAAGTTATGGQYN